MNERILYKVAEMYYNAELSMPEIARRLGVTPMTISRYLNRAKEMGIVTITVRRPFLSAVDYESRLRKKFGLLNAVVVVADDGDAKRSIARAAGEFLYVTLWDGATVGIGVGGTTSAIVDYLPEESFPLTNVVQLLGGFENTGSINSHDILVRFTQKLGAKGFYFHAPVYVRDAGTRNTILKETCTHTLVQMWDKCDLAFLGAGNADKESIYVKSGFITPAEMDSIVASGGVGDILGHFFDDNGIMLNHSINRRVLSIPLSKLKGIDNVVLVSGGVNKAATVRAALRTGLINSLITDHRCANRILESDSKTKAEVM